LAWDKIFSCAFQKSGRPALSSCRPAALGKPRRAKSRRNKSHPELPATGEAGNEGPESQHPPGGFPFRTASARQE